jgi:hypothetical protein
VIELNALNEGQCRALALADNRIAMNSSWEEEMLRAEIAALDFAGEPVSGLEFADTEFAAPGAQIAADAIESVEGDTEAKLGDGLKYSIVMRCKCEKASR